ncbi:MULTISPECIES: glycosyl hydrolase [Yersiniaceae]|uniref:Asl1-like glycosyl hydrolase catalytic domain-containing protein n=1 Tax=Nissabacter archeti TaxID=1917880 RepID=A0ABS5JLP6_9GAMM|nr:MULTISPECIES: glycosyl hydrolase [Yersiniaceae]MBS0970860.1 hypothetical protein [Nissabacter archeti]MDV5139204.1 glycosyl hydrolase [Chimaeribacter arupi]
MVSKSQKRGIAYDLSSVNDLKAISAGISWYYNWGASPHSSLPFSLSAVHGVDYIPMLWNENFHEASVLRFFRENPGIKYMLVLNEPTIGLQAYTEPQRAAELWPRFENIARQVGVSIVGPQVTWGTMPDYQAPADWLDAFIAAYITNNGKPPQIDFLGFHWYDYGLEDQLNLLARFGKPFWVTEFANAHSRQDGAQIDSLEKQKAQMSEMVALCERREDVFRYAWFTGRVNPDPHFQRLFEGDGELSALGQYYISLPH